MAYKGTNFWLTMAGLLVFILISLRTSRTEGLAIIKRQHTAVRWACYFALVFAVLFFSAENSGEFIYNRF